MSKPWKNMVTDQKVVSNHQIEMIKPNSVEDDVPDFPSDLEFAFKMKK